MVIIIYNDQYRLPFHEKKKVVCCIILEYLGGIITYYSDLKLFTGFILAARTDWKLTVIKVIKIAATQVSANIHQGKFVR